MAETKTQKQCLLFFCAAQPWCTLNKRLIFDPDGPYYDFSESSFNSFGPFAWYNKRKMEYSKKAPPGVRLFAEWTGLEPEAQNASNHLNAYDLMKNSPKTHLKSYQNAPIYVVTYFH
ncbi:MAG: hypothetical protein JWR02_2331 [Mucilaginibacter sp.]|nr:hypothetical protein [Mucilaginibacter sp.]